MSKTVFTLPEDLLPADTGLMAWVEDLGIDPARVVIDQFRIDESDDHSLTLHYLEFDLTEDGKRIVSVAAGGYIKTPRSVPVASIPTLQTVVTA